MALKFLNKKGWHTGSLRNIETVWKAERRRDTEKQKTEELQKQIRDEHEKQEVRQLQLQAGLVSGPERLEFLYSGVGAGKATAEEHLLGKPVEDPKGESILEQVAAAPGSLFVEEKISANDSWRKIRSDPLLLIKQQELAARKRVLNNPVLVERLKKEAEEKLRLKAEKKQKRKEKKELKRKRKGKGKESDTEDDREPLKQAEDTSRAVEMSEDRNRDEEQGPRDRDRDGDRQRARLDDRDRDGYRTRHEDRPRDRDRDGDRTRNEDRTRDRDEDRRGRGRPPVSRKRQLTDEEKAAILEEMQRDAEIHEEQRRKRLKVAEVDEKIQEEKDAARPSNNFLERTNRSVYGTENSGGSVADTIHRRSHYRDKFTDANAFKR